MSVKYFREQAESKITNSPNPEPKNAEIKKKNAQPTKLGQFETIG